MKTWNVASAVAALTLAATPMAFAQTSHSNGSNTQNGIGQQQGQANAGAQLMVSPKVVRRIKQKLDQSGYNPGTVNSKWDQQASKALRKYQQAQGLQATGNINLSTLVTMGIYRQNGGGQMQGGYGNAGVGGSAGMGNTGVQGNAGLGNTGVGGSAGTSGMGTGIGGNAGTSGTGTGVGGNVGAGGTSVGGNVGTGGTGIGGSAGTSGSGASGNVGTGGANNSFGNHGGLNNNGLYNNNKNNNSGNNANSGNNNPPL